MLTIKQSTSVSILSDNLTDYDLGIIEETDKKFRNDLLLSSLLTNKLVDSEVRPRKHKQAIEFENTATNQSPVYGRKRILKPSWN